MTDNIFVTVGGWVLALLVALVSGIVQWRKGSVDETAMVLGKWKELVDAHQTQIEVLNNQIAAQALELKDVRERLVKAEQRIRELEEENAGLKRAVIQNSQSAALRLGRTFEQGEEMPIEGTEP